MHPPNNDDLPAQSTHRLAATNNDTLPFQQTKLGNLPGEIREKIYGHVLIIRATQAGSQASVLMSNKGFPGSRLAVLGVCRQMYLEARHMFYAKNTLQFAKPTDFVHFLKMIGPIRRASVTSLHFANLLETQPFLSKDRIDVFCLEHNVPEDGRNYLESCTCERPNLAAEKAAQMLEHCSGVRNIKLDINMGDESTYISYILSIPGLTTGAVEITDPADWLVRKSVIGDSWYIDFLAEQTANLSRGSDRKPGDIYTVAVSILPPLSVGKTEYYALRRQLNSIRNAPNASATAGPSIQQIPEPQSVLQLLADVHAVDAFRI